MQKENVYLLYLVYVLEIIIIKYCKLLLQNYLNSIIITCIWLLTLNYSLVFELFGKLPFDIVVGNSTKFIAAKKK